MRMWMVDPKTMCRKHLLGEHYEIHMLIGSMRRGKSIMKYIETKLLQPSAAAKRHDELVDRRAVGRDGFTHTHLSHDPEGMPPAHHCARVTTTHGAAHPSLRRSMPSWATDAMSAPSALNIRPTPKPRPPEADGLDIV